MDRKDGNELLFKITLSSFLGIIIPVIITSILLIRNDFPLHVYFQTHNIIIECIFALFWGYFMLIVSWNACFMFLSAIIHYKSTTLLLNTKLVYKLEQTPQEKYQNCLLYRTFQLQHTNVDTQLKHMFGLIITSTCLIEIFWLFLFIRQFGKVPISLAIYQLQSPITVFITMVIVCNMINNLTNASINYIQSFSKTKLLIVKEFNSKLEDRNILFDEKLFKSFRPLYVNIGNVLKVSNTTIIFLTFEIVVNNLMSLLLAYQ